MGMVLLTTLALILSQGRHRMLGCFRSMLFILKGHFIPDILLFSLLYDFDFATSDPFGHYGFKAIILI
jgi:hypothetical protein